MIKKLEAKNLDIKLTSSENDGQRFKDIDNKLKE